MKHQLYKDQTAGQIQRKSIRVDVYMKHAIARACSQAAIHNASTIFSPSHSIASMIDDMALRSDAKKLT